MDILRGNDLTDYKVGNLRICSSFRANKASPDTNCSYNFDLGGVSMLSSVKKINLNSVSICNNFNNVASYNNYFDFQWFDGVLHTVQIVVPPNYYSYSALATQLQTQIQALDPILATFTFTFDTTVQKYKYDTGNPAVGAGFFASLSVPNLENNNFLYLIGSNPISSGLNVSTTLSYRPALFGAVVAYICSSRLGIGHSIKSQIIDDSVNRQVVAISSNELISIHITSDFGAYTSYYDQGSMRGEIAYQTPQQLTQFDISIQDQYGNVLETNDINAPNYLNFSIYY